MKLNEIQDLIKFVAKSGVSEVELETKDVKIVIKTPSGKKEQVLVQGTAAPTVYQAAAPVAAAQPQAVAPEARPVEAKPTKAADDESKYVTVKSPMIGTFYRSPSPESGSYVEVGAEVNPDTVVCIIEAMKVMNEIKAEVKGVITQVLVDNAKPVEFGQPLFKFRPS